MTSPVPVSVVVPTHNHPYTLPYSVGSILAQDHTELQVVIVGDGVGDDTRDVVSDLVRSDRRIRFVDRPKSGRTGEPSRHEVVSALDTRAVVYHGDDDLAFPHHLRTMLELLDGHDFAHPLPVFVGPDGVSARWTRLSRRAWRRACMWPWNHNEVCLTGVAHTMESYRRLPHGWRQTPPGIATDRYMWQQFLALPGLRVAGGTTATTVKMPSSSRQGSTPSQRQAEMARWAALVADPAFRTSWDNAIANHRRQTMALRAVQEVSVTGMTGPGPDWWLRLNTRAFRVAHLRTMRTPVPIPAVDAVTSDQ